MILMTWPYSLIIVVFMYKKRWCNGGEVAFVIINYYYCHINRCYNNCFNRDNYRRRVNKIH